MPDKANIGDDHNSGHQHNRVTMPCVVTQTAGRFASNTDYFFQGAERLMEYVPTQSVGTRWHNPSTSAKVMSDVGWAMPTDKGRVSIHAPACMEICGTVML